MSNTTWEYGTNERQAVSSDAYVSYTYESVMRYRAESIEQILETPKLLLDMIRHHREYQVPRLETLEAYYLGNNRQILTGQRRQEQGKSDHRIRHSFASLISDFLNTYVLSIPVKVRDVYATEQSDFVGIVDDFGIANDIDAHNLEIGKDQNNFGRAFELLVRTENDQDKIYRLEPREVFMIYDRTVASKVIGACRYYPENELDPTSKYLVELYTPEFIYRFLPHSLTTGRLQLSDTPPEPHLFMGVPIVEYRSDRYRMGVYEKQLPLIDAYDAAQSDTANYMTDFNDAILVIEGLLKNADDPEYLRKMKDANLLVLIPSEDSDGMRGAVKAHYLTKSYDVAGVEAYKARLKEDIFSQASVPNLSDEAFAGNRSGEALKYKLFGLQQKRSDKEKFLAKGFRVRYKLLENLKRNVQEYSGDPVQLDFQFSQNLPTAYLEELQAFINSGGQLSQETMLSLLSFVDDVQQEMERVEAENAVPVLPAADTIGGGAWPLMTDTLSTP
ncbi:MAG: phage portal protein [Bacillota bacterium]|nr:phage portal protein [Bacillota bacterium]